MYPPDFKFYLSRFTNKKSPYGVMLILSIFSLLAIITIKTQRKQTEIFVEANTETFVYNFIVIPLIASEG